MSSQAHEVIGDFVGEVAGLMIHSGGLNDMLREVGAKD